jgi:hypothetical protein
MSATRAKKYRDYWGQEASRVRMLAYNKGPQLAWIDICKKVVVTYPANSPIAHKLLEHVEDRTFIGEIRSTDTKSKIFDLIEDAGKLSREAQRERVAGVALTRAIALCRSSGWHVERNF